MAEAVLRHGALSGVMLGLHRLGRCHPFGGSGHDPVPGAFALWDAEAAAGSEGAFRLRRPKHAGIQNLDPRVRGGDRAPFVIPKEAGIQTGNVIRNPWKSA